MKTAYPKKAFILAAGFGTRLSPLSLVRPKPLMPLWGKPVIEHVIRLLASWQVEEIIINLHHQPDQIVRFIQSLDIPHLRFHFSREKDILGTGGALAHARSLLGNDPFWLLNADVAASVNPMPFLHTFQRHHPLAVLWMNDQSGPRTVALRNRRIDTFHAPHPGAQGTCTFCGLHLLSPEILNWIPPLGFSSIITAYEQAMADGRTVLGLTPSPVFWSDIGTPAQYLDAHVQTALAHAQGLPGGELFDPNYRNTTNNAVQSDAFSALDPASVAGAGCRVQESVLWDSARLTRGVTIRRCIVATGATVYKRGEYHHTLFTPAGATLTTPEKQAMADWLKEPVTVESLPPRGSNRSFSRLTSATASAMLIRYDAEARPENLHYAGHTRWLERRGLPVPRVLHHSVKQHFMIMEDGGREDLTARMQTCTSGEALRLYRQVLDAVVHLHTECTRALIRHPLSLEKSFDDSLYRWEHDLFFNEFVHPRKRLTVRQRDALSEELDTISGLLLGQPLVLIHRDLQSSNILLNRRRIVLIDYQGMRLGAAAYDLASLLCDPYVPLNEKTRMELLNAYNQKNISAPVSTQIFFAGAVQRLVQALGAYGRLSNTAATSRFSIYITPALHRLDSALSYFPELTKLQQLTQSLASC